jgi:hypothetical protein
VGRIGGNLAVVEKQTQVRILLLLLLFIEHGQRLASRYLLLIVDLAETENGAVHRSLPSFVRWMLRRNMLRKRARNTGAKGRHVVFTLPIQSSKMETHDLTTKTMARISKIVSNCESSVRIGPSIVIQARGDRDARRAYADGLGAEPD